MLFFEYDFLISAKPLSQLLFVCDSIAEEPPRKQERLA
jgi:hypothetical protein